MNIIVHVSEWEDSFTENHFPNFTTTSEYTKDELLMIPQDILTKVLKHLEIDSYQDTVVIGGSNILRSESGVIDDSQDEEIWDVASIVDNIVVLSEDLHKNEFSWGFVALGTINLKVKDTIYTIPVYWTQNAHPIGLVISRKHRELIESIS